MSTSQYSLQRVLPPISFLIGILGLSGGVYSFVNPQAASGVIGIPISTANPQGLSFVTFTGVRNFSSGLTILALLYNGQKKAVGTVLMCGVSVALADTWICFQHDRWEGKGLGHAITGVFLGLLGAGMYWG